MKKVENHCAKECGNVRDGCKKLSVKAMLLNALQELSSGQGKSCIYDIICRIIILIFSAPMLPYLFLYSYINPTFISCTTKYYPD